MVRLRWLYAGALATAASHHQRRGNRQVSDRPTLIRDGGNDLIAGDAQDDGFLYGLTAFQE